MKQKIIYVDGFKIRNTLDIDFGIAEYYHPYGFPATWYIPRNEFWIEKRLKDETDFFLAVENLYTKLNKTIKEFRILRTTLSRKICIPIKPPLKNFTTRIYHKYGFLVREIDGGIVRKSFDPFFTIGGNSAVYSYVPKGEIWLDAKMNPKEIPYHLVHETIECLLMQKGFSYDVSHEYATAADKEMRRRDGVMFPGDEDIKTKKLFVKTLLEFLRSFSTHAHNQ